MITINEHYLKLQASYLFSDIAKRVAAFQEQNPEIEIIKLGIGDVTRPLPRACIDAFHKAVEEMASEASFRGYGPEQGYAFLREAIAANDFQARGADIQADEIFVSDGAKCDTGNIQELFSQDIKIAIPDPVYPVYLDTNVMAGRTGAYVDGRYQGIVYLDSTKENNFVPALPREKVDLIYLCFPNNPTGSTISTAELKTWVDYAREHQALILFDAAYEIFIRDQSLPHTIYEIEGAKEVAIEFRSYSKSAGFTGTRCAYTVIPKECTAYDRNGGRQPLHSLWNRRHCTKFNGVSYPVQRAAEAVYSEEGKTQTRELADYYLHNAASVRRAMQDLGFFFVGGENSPYVWINGGRDSWDFFDMLLNKAGVVCTPGAGFGRCGNGYIRISAFNSHEKVEKAMKRLKDALS
ncbi:LL-diaminopimelate aminotransferase [Desulfoprunum benzoelyticum]|uniref:LL-diaminopimelate aminotransferase n=1 Tax=Desulfoprunum benzoelyticum TaxID=1506996 RepID=A0A840ULP6_9BACT|nr:LL-diaminopimelate aminotransferase [Desulfoprunum benzoelyticum]MBB5346525.1 LL-diaminopimelate aminotransferase [Desulfoprunum benzoelyticum]MBM9528946.1 LL-diaminopimelate aminotransferase [Desulfoprunum benzoelyticum]